MMRLHTAVGSALALVMGMTAVQADAQSLRGFRAELDAGASSFHSEGNSKTKFGWGAAIGVDAQIANSFVLGAEGTFWRAPATNHTIDGAGLANHRTGTEWGLAARAGFLVTPSTLVYGKVGWVRNEQRKEFLPFLPDTTTPGTSATPGYYNLHTHNSGIVWGGGIEQNLTETFYVKAEGRYSDYKNHTHTLTGLVGLGILLGSSHEAAPPPPPPPPPPPAQRGERG
jgi:outer membrane immunogenic protein